MPTLKIDNWKLKIHPASGFTLIEMLVSVAVFSAVVVVALTALLNIKSLQSKASAIRTINNNINFAMELMSREIRTGKEYCKLGCIGDGNFEFINDSGDKVVYNFDSVNEKITRTENDSTTLDITAPEVTVNKLRFITSDLLLGDQIQPSVTIIINAVTNDQKTKLNSSLDIQTTISKRQIGA